MVRKRLDERVRTLIERGVKKSERSMLVLVGDHGKDQVPNLHHLLSRSAISARPKVLWCYKKELGFSTHRLKRMKKIKRDKARGLAKGTLNNSVDQTADNFELFISSTDINWCYYRDTHRILGSTVGMLVLQDFEALTPNLMARTIETVEGGGLVVFLLRTVSSLKQLYAMTMDVHSRYRTEGSGDVVPRFNERFLLSLADCPSCLLCDDELNILPLSKKCLKQLDGINGDNFDTIISKGDGGEVIKTTYEESVQLQALKDELADAPHVGVLVEQTKTFDQARAVLTFLDAACTSNNADTNNTFCNQTTTMALTAGRGRGKSASIGLCLAGALSFGFNNICVTAPEPENLVAVFNFVLVGLKALKYQEHLDFTITYDPTKTGRENVKTILAIHVHNRNDRHKQTIRYVRPEHKDKFASADIIAIDEAAAIPLPIVKELLKQGGTDTDHNSTMHNTTASIHRLVFMSSTINGYEGTGRALSLKLIKDLKHQSSSRPSIQAAITAAKAIHGPKSNKGEVKIHEARWKAAAAAVSAQDSSSSITTPSSISQPFREIKLSTPIRYALNDPIESWLNSLLCLDCHDADDSDKNGIGNDNMDTFIKLHHGAPAPSQCELYSVQRDALFSYHKLSEAFLQKLMGIYTSAHYKNTPNDLQMLSDAPAHALFVLLSPNAEENNTSSASSSPSSLLPDILAIIQVALEGKVSKKAVEAQLARGHRSAGDLIPWTISQQFNDSTFARLSGARIVRVAVHPSLQNMGYGSRAVELLYRYYNGEIFSMEDDNSQNGDDNGIISTSDYDEAEYSSDQQDSNLNSSEKTKKRLSKERIKPRKALPPLLLPLSEIKAPNLDWIGTSFGLTPELHRFWKRSGMHLLYLRQTKNELTGEHSCIMIRSFGSSRTGYDNAWLPAFVLDTRRRLISLLSGPFNDINIKLAISVLEEFESVAKEAQRNLKNQDTLNEIQKRSGGKNPSSFTSSPSNNLQKSLPINAQELNYYITPHDLKRLELYGRNLCDYHLITDLLPTISRLYFLGKFGENFNLSSLQGALLCGIGLQNRTIDNLTSEFGLPSNQVLAMFNKGVRKMSIALQQIVEDQVVQEEILGNEVRSQVEKKVVQMKDVTLTTLDEEAQDGASAAMSILKDQNSYNKLPHEIEADTEIMKYAIKGTDAQWDEALEKKGTLLDENKGLVQIKRQDKITPKRKLNDEDIGKEGNAAEILDAKKQKSKKKKKKKQKN
mmetsp:Transcript_10072/g.14242  ORF Transcript_10072/g.14242 Transcript_10072/m.14242 type:complete len:1228 (-) Transcript_10072:124-3807(-)|eukprot:CAMPEP_0184856910 /NCGR_PEP_ID=MMETSP0580-20130426/2068_1 /TAXON_ID=1118495 /ORGANISM="Dactyliosolen fragilissimus" /LENGTH=1227 /DNA_ID=CAMNT_0027352179 /DNA_START=121 /DNA_END=3804 /DNA_ORIENTATION=+